MRIPVVSRARKAAEVDHARGLATRIRRSAASCTITLVDVIGVCVSAPALLLDWTLSSRIYRPGSLTLANKP